MCVVISGYRYYSAELGRWISRDPLGEEGGINLFVFTLNDPLNTVDKLGLDVFTIWSHGYGEAVTFGAFYADVSGTVSIEYDSSTCCYEVKIKNHIEAGIGAAKGKMKRVGRAGVEWWYQYKAKAALVNMKYDADVTILKKCKGDDPTVSLNATILEGFWGGKAQLEVKGGAKIFKIAEGVVEGSGEVQGGFFLGLGITANGVMNFDKFPPKASITGNVWLSGKVDSYYKVQSKLKVKLWKWQPEWLNWGGDTYEWHADDFGWDKHPIVRF